MKWGYVLLAVLLIGSTAAETIKLVDYNITFNLSTPYSIAYPRSESYRDGDRASKIEMAEINSPKGYIGVTLIESNLSTQSSFEDAITRIIPSSPPCPIIIDNRSAWYVLTNSGGNYTYWLVQYLEPTKGLNFTETPPARGETTVSYMIVGDMPLYDVVDFFRSLHIEKRSA